jgi:hypothetical protein
MLERSAKCKWPGMPCLFGYILWQLKSVFAQAEFKPRDLIMAVWLTVASYIDTFWYTDWGILQEMKGKTFWDNLYDGASPTKTVLVCGSCSLRDMALSDNLSLYTSVLYSVLP